MGKEQRLLASKGKEKEIVAINQQTSNKGKGNLASAKKNTNTKKGKGKEKQPTILEFAKSLSPTQVLSKMMMALREFEKASKTLVGITEQSNVVDGATTSDVKGNPTS